MPSGSVRGRRHRRAVLSGYRRRGKPAKYRHFSIRTRQGRTSLPWPGNRIWNFPSVDFAGSIISVSCAGGSAGFAICAGDGSLTIRLIDVITGAGTTDGVEATDITGGTGRASGTAVNAAGCAGVAASAGGDVTPSAGNRLRATSSPLSKSATLSHSLARISSISASSHRRGISISKKPFSFWSINCIPRPVTAHCLPIQWMSRCRGICCFCYLSCSTTLRPPI